MINLLDTITYDQFMGFLKIANKLIRSIPNTHPNREAALGVILDGICRYCGNDSPCTCMMDE